MSIMIISILLTLSIAFIGFSITLMSKCIKTANQGIKEGNKKLLKRGNKMVYWSLINVIGLAIPIIFLIIDILNFINQNQISILTYISGILIICFFISFLTLLMFYIIYPVK